MKIEVNLPDEIVEGLRAKSRAGGVSLNAYATERVREILTEDDAELTTAQRKAIDARLAEGLDDIEKGRSHVDAVLRRLEGRAEGLR